MNSHHSNLKIGIKRMVEWNGEQWNWEQVGQPASHTVLRVA